MVKNWILLGDEAFNEAVRYETLSFDLNKHFTLPVG